jgi:CheY-like chemotaxis protein
MGYQQVPVPGFGRVRERPPPYGADNGGLPRLLLVEDSALARRVVTRVLAGAFHVTAFADAETALGRFRRGAFDVVLADHHMVAMTGLELLEQLRVIDPFVRRVLMSGSEIPGIEGHLATGLIELWLLKPVDLRAALVALIGRKELLS